MDTPPPTGLLKCNVDASLSGKPGSLGTGEVLRDNEGNFLCIFSCPTHIKESNMDRVLAIKKAFQLNIVCFYAYYRLYYGVWFL